MGRDFLYPTAFIWRSSLVGGSKNAAFRLLPAVLSAELQAFARWLPVCAVESAHNGRPEASNHF
jgi:hypothetical protein